MPGFEVINYKEKKAVAKIFEEGGVLFAHGFEKIRKKFHVRDFEKKFSSKIKSKYSLAVSSGTAAIKIALKALGVKPGDEVITQSFNFIATVEAILDIGAIPKIANVDFTLNIDPKEIQKLITSKTKVIIPVHMLGVAAKMKEILNIAKKNKLYVLEDNCESLGAKYHNKHLGTLGDIGVFSFDYGKIITSGEGGMITTNNKLFDKFSREYHDHGHENNTNLPRGRDTKTIYGFNYRMTELQAAIGKVQLLKLSSILKENKLRYNELKKNIKKRFKIRDEPENSTSCFDTFIFFVDDKRLREEIISFLRKESFGTKNLPDAIEWHCSYFWDHALPKSQVKNSIKTMKILSSAIAIPIWLKKSVIEYKLLGKSLRLL